MFALPYSLFAVHVSLPPTLIATPLPASPPPCFAMEKEVDLRVERIHTNEVVLACITFFWTHLPTTLYLMCTLGSLPH